MQGPYPAGNFNGVRVSMPSRFVPGKAYRIIKPFQDADGHDHPVGETWVFLGDMFNKFDDELVLCIRLPDLSEWRLPLIWRPDRHEDVIMRWKDYLTPA